MGLSVYGNNKFSEVDSNNDTWIKLYNFIPQNSRVLDIGCSTGNLGKKLIESKKCEVYGIDIFEEDLKVARKNLTHVEKMNIEKDSIDHLGTFDVVLMADVIEHLINPNNALDKIKKVLKPKGCLIFSVPNMANFSVRIELLKGRFEYTDFGLLDETHLHYYDRIQLENTLQKSGLFVEEYNNRIRDIPKKILNKEIRSLGLSPNEKFWKLANHPDSTAFQFIGRATQKNNKHTKVSSKTPNDFFEQHIDRREKLLSENIRALSQENSKRKNLENELIAKNRELDSIYKSKGWRMLKILYGLKHKISTRAK